MSKLSAQTLVRQAAALKVSNKILTEISSPDPKCVEVIRSRLLQHYSQFELTSLYGRKAVEYVSGLCTRCSLWTLALPQPSFNSKDEAYVEAMLAAEAHALWLSIITLVDGVLDTAMDRTALPHVGRALLQILRGIFEESEYYMDQYILPISEETNGEEDNKTVALLNSLLEAFDATFSRYHALLTPFRMKYPSAFEQVNIWLYRYLENACEELSDKGPVSDETEAFSVLENFAEWRRIDGAMMCVVWHQLLFLGVSSEAVSDQHLDLLRTASLVVAYHNDILSLLRDIDQSTPNLVKCILSFYFQDNLDAYTNPIGSLSESLQTAIAHTNELYQTQESFIQQFNETKIDRLISHVALTITLGCHNWHNSEDRYRSGRQLIDYLISNNEQDLTELLSKLLEDKHFTSNSELRSFLLKRNTQVLEAVSGDPGSC